jgi:hypothetical protein
LSETFAPLGTYENFGEITAIGYDFPASAIMAERSGRNQITLP